MSRYRNISESEAELWAVKRRLLVEQNRGLLTFAKPPREKRKSQSQQIAEIQAMARNIGRAEGDQHRLPLGGRELAPEPVEQSEDELQFEIVGIIRRHNPEAIIQHSPNLRGVPPHMRHAIREINHKLGYEAGTFDLRVDTRDAKLAIEIKSPKGGWVSEKQERWQARFKATGGSTLISNDKYQIIEFLKRHGIGRYG